MNKKHLVIGLGEVGTAIKNILDCDGIDIETGMSGEYDVVHICFPYSDKFIEYVKTYQEEYRPEITIIHSTVPIGTSKQLGAVHSPIRGVHPNLEEGIRTFVKYFGGEKAKEAADIFYEKGIPIVPTPNSDSTEAMKLLDTLQYGLNIMIEKEIHKFCLDKNVDFNIAYVYANRTYNSGYTKLGREDVVRPYLNHMEGPIGGHCVIPNTELIDFWMADLLKQKNEEYKNQ